MSMLFRDRGKRAQERSLIATSDWLQRQKGRNMLSVETLHQLTSNDAHKKSSELREQKNYAEALVYSLVAVNLGLRAKKVNAWHVRNAAHLLNELRLFHVAINLLNTAATEATDTKPIALEFSRALNAAGLTKEALDWANHGLEGSTDPVEQRKLNFARDAALKKTGKSPGPVAADKSVRRF